MILEKLQDVFVIAMLVSIIDIAFVQQLKTNIVKLNGISVNIISAIMCVVLTVLVIYTLFEIKITTIEDYMFVALTAIIAFSGADAIYKAFREKLAYLKENPLVFTDEDGDNPDEVVK